MKRRKTISVKPAAYLLAAILLSACTAGEQPEAVEYGGVRFLPLQAERLPDLPSPRTGHVLLPVPGGFMAAGGHTTGFVPVQEADLFRDGKWAVLPTLYTHDTPFALPLKDGRIVIGGGYAESFGIGQGWGVECYDPASGTFSPLPILDLKRAHATAVELNGGKLVISGNWYQEDGIERYVFDDYDRLSHPVGVTRSYPYVLRSDMDNVLVFGSRDGKFNPRSCEVDRWDGDSFEVPLFREWVPYAYINHGPLADEAFIGDMSTGHFSYLVHVQDTSGSRSALARVTGETFSLLETTRDIPTEGPWGPISYNSYVQADRSSQTAWLLGVDEDRRVYLAGIGYGDALSGGKAEVTLYCTAPLEGVGRYPNSRLLPDGSLVLAGGIDESNYEPYGAVWLFSPHPVSRERRAWPLIFAGLILFGGGIVLGLLRRRAMEETPLPAPAAPPRMADRIDALMQDRQLFRKPDLRLADIARELGTNNTYVSACINGETGLSFPDYVAGYRIRHAQEMLREQPDRLLSEVAVESGFASEKSFFRTFKAHTGLTPGEWKEKNL